MKNEYIFKNIYYHNYFSISRRFPSTNEETDEESNPCLPRHQRHLPSERVCWIFRFYAEIYGISIPDFSV